MSEREKKDGGCIDSWRDCCTNAIISFPAAERLDAGPKYLTRSNFLPHLHGKLMSACSCQSTQRNFYHTEPHRACI